MGIVIALSGLNGGSFVPLPEIEFYPSQWAIQILFFILLTTQILFHDFQASIRYRKKIIRQTAFTIPSYGKHNQIVVAVN